MVSKEVLVKGIFKYINEHLLVQIPPDSWKRVAVNAALGLAAPALDQKLETLLNGEMIQSLGIVSPDGMVDEEALCNAIKANTPPAGFKIPVGVIGTFTILPDDIDIIKSCIQSFK